MPGCAVVGCNSHNRNTKGTEVVLHCFLRDASLRKIWLSKCYRKYPVNVENARICSRHFKDTDYVRDLCAELLNLPPKRVHKNDAYPSCNLPCDSIVSDSSSDTIEDKKERFNKRDIRRRSIDTLKKLSPLKKNVDKCTFTDEVVCYDSDKVALQNSVAALQKRISHLQNMCMKLQARNKDLSSQLSSTKRRLPEKERNKNALVSREINRILGKIWCKRTIFRSLD